MTEYLVKIRNTASRFLYGKIAKPIFFRIEPEKIHDAMLVFGKLLGSNFITRNIAALLFNYRDPRLEQNILGIHFKNPVGLAAGFDKNAALVKILPAVGFGFAELGSITGQACPGNPKPRLWRLQKSAGLVVHYGLKNDGCEKIAKRLKNKKFAIPIGLSIAKTNSRDTISKENGIKDYCKAFQTLKDIPSYLTINISCPNAFGGQPFTKSEDLDDLLNEIDKIPNTKPIFLKLPPDLAEPELDGTIAVCQNHKVSGFICTNLTKDRSNEEIKKYLHAADAKTVGGISGQPIKRRATETIRIVYKKTAGKYIIIGCGGVFSAQDAYEKIKAGASLIQLITGMIFQGPQLISEINQGLVKLLAQDGYHNIAEAIGTGNKDDK